MIFLDAVQKMKEGKKVRLPGLRPIKFEGHIVFADVDKREVYPFNIFEIENTNWEVVEERKTLFDKRWERAIEHYHYYENEVKESLKEFIGHLRKEGDMRGNNYNKAKEIFGKELIQ